MRPQWIDSLRLILLLSVLLSGSSFVVAGGLGEAGPGVREEDVEEPQIALPEVSGVSPFHNVSRSLRQGSDDKLIQLCQQAVDATSRRMLSTELHTPWQMMHALLGLRQDFYVMHEGKAVSGLDWIAQGQVFKDEYWFQKTEHGGRAHPFSVPYAFEGHANQCLAVLSMCGVELDREFGTASGPVTMREMIHNAQMTVSSKDEPTWTLWALSRYLPPEARWRNDRGEEWSIEKLVQLQCTKPIVRGAPCGGTHALFALAHARNVYQRQGKPLRGVWLQAEYKIRQFTNTARMQQNSSGILSSNFFRGRTHNPDFNKRMASAGHLLEFLMIALPQEELKSRWVRRAVEATARELLNNRKAYVKCSPLYHSVDALNIYLDRVNPRQVPTRTADAGEETKTARLRPRLRPLKPVPALSISSSRDLADGEQRPADADDSVEDIPPVDSVKESHTRRKSHASRRPSSREVERDRDGWEATGQGRQKTMVVEQSPDLASPPTTVPDPESESTTDPAAVGDNAADADEAAADSSSTDVSRVEPSPSPAAEVLERAETFVIRGRKGFPNTDAWPENSPAPGSSVGVCESLSVDEVTADHSNGESANDSAVPEAAEHSEPASSEALGHDGSTEAGESQTGGVPAASVSMARVIETEEPEAAAQRISGMEHLAAGSLVEFQNPELDVAKWADAFSSPEREICVAHDAVLAALGLSDGMFVADVGSGTGFFVPGLSDAVGNTGRVFAIDVSPRFVEHLVTRVETESLANVDVVRNHSRSLMLMRHKVDRILVCDSYHHFEDPQEMLSSMFSALRDNGEIVLVSPRQGSEKLGVEALASVRGDQATFANEFVAAGFDYVGQIEVEELAFHYVLRFRKPGPE